MDRRAYLATIGGIGTSLLAGCSSITIEDGDINIGDDTQETEETQTTVDPDATLVTITDSYTDKYKENPRIPYLNEHNYNPDIEEREDRRWLGEVVIPRVVTFWNQHSDELTDENVAYQYDTSLTPSEADIIIEIGDHDTRSYNLPSSQIDPVVSMETNNFQDSDEDQRRDDASDVVEQFTVGGSWVTTSSSDRTPTNPNATIKHEWVHREVKISVESLKTAVGYALGQPLIEQPDDVMNPRRLLYPHVPEYNSQDLKFELYEKSLSVIKSYQNARFNVSTTKYTTAEEHIQTGLNQIQEIRSYYEDTIQPTLEPISSDTLTTHIDDSDEFLDQLESAFNALITEHIEKDNKYVGLRPGRDTPPHLLTYEDIWTSPIYPPYVIKFGVWEYWITNGANAFSTQD